MVQVFDVPQQEFIEETARELKAHGKFKPPVWAAYVKTGVHKERPPMNPDWWYQRAASVMKKILVLGPVGTQKLKKKYGGKQRRGHKPAIQRDGSGKIIRTILQQLEQAGYAKTVKEPRKGRILTPQGRSFLEKTATKVYKGKTPAT